jgi:voltage-dependent potassium channel beta subunit
MAAENENDNSMAFRVLGNTGLQVSVFSFGFWGTYGSKADLKDDEGLEAAKDVLRAAREVGVNLFDNAEAYGSPRGSAERIMGEAIQQLRKEDPELWRRSDLIITTKIFWGGDGINEKGLSVKHIREGMDASLKRLQVDYVDLVFCHRPDPLTPTETVVRAMTNIVRTGKATSWGTSAWTAVQIMEAIWMAKSLGLEPPQYEQPQYHMFERKAVETDLFPLYQAPYNLGTTTWSPLGAGVLTGRYNDGIPEGSRAATEGYGWITARFNDWKASGKIDKVKQLMELATTKYNCPVAQLVLAWTVKNPNVSTVLLGASKPEQLTSNIQALGIARRMTAEGYEEINAILNNTPPTYEGAGNSKYTFARSISGNPL